MGGFIIFINIVLDKWVITKVVGTCRLYDIKWKLNQLKFKETGLVIWWQFEVIENSLNSWNKTSIKTEGNETREVYEIEESGLILVGIIGIQDILKDGVEQAVKNCLRAKINVIMVTGDNLTTACAIAKSCKIMSQESGKSKAYLGDVLNNLK